MLLNPGWYLILELPFLKLVQLSLRFLSNRELEEESINAQILVTKLLKSSQQFLRKMRSFEKRVSEINAFKVLKDVCDHSECKILSLNAVFKRRP